MRVNSPEMVSNNISIPKRHNVRRNKLLYILFMMVIDVVWVIALRLGENTMA